MSSISSSIGAAATEFTGARRVEMSKALGRLQKQSTATRIAVLLGLFALTGWFDLILDHDLSLFALYLVPTLYSVWYLGRRWAYASCVAGGIVWFIDDWPGWHSYHHAFVPYGNLAGRLAVLIIVVAIVSALRDALEDQYEAERRVAFRELEIASEVQRRLLPSKLPDYPGVDLGFFYRPAQELGGDYYDFIPLSPERIAIAVGDVSGKGLPSALLVASLQSLVRTSMVMRGGNLARFAKEISERLYEQTSEELFVTLFFGIIDTSHMAFHYVNAGHNPPLFVRQGTLSPQHSSTEMWDRGGPPLGLFSQTQYSSGKGLLQEGDVLVLYTDGLLDAANKDGEQFGEERFREAVRSSLSLTASEICQEVIDQLDAFSAGSSQWDDITLALVKVKSEAGDLSTVGKEEQRGTEQ